VDQQRHLAVWLALFNNMDLLAVDCIQRHRPFLFSP
jgi:hypothetical protein